VSDDRLDSYERLTDWPLTIAAVAFLVVYAWPILDPGLPARARTACVVANLVIWTLFWVDYLLRVGLASDKRRFLRGHLTDLVVLVLPILRPLRALRVITALGRLNRRAAVSFRGRTAVYVFGAVALIAFVASLAVLDAERGSRGANIVNFGDALWWTASTITTVGYGDLFPTTGEGRIVGVALMVGGIALVGTVTASLASWFIERVGVLEEAEAETRDDVAELAEEVRALRQALEHRRGSPGPID
jgi:voltage-gated potassium channel